MKRLNALHFGPGTYPIYARKCPKIAVKRMVFLDDVDYVLEALLWGGRA
jgi:hypothetical protein